MVPLEKSLSRKIGEGLFWFVSNTLIVKVIGLVSVFLILHRFSVYEYGVSELVFSVVAIMTLFLLPGLNDLILAEIGREKGQKNSGAMKKLFFDYGKLGLVSGAVLWAVMFFGADVISGYYGKNIALFFRISSFIFLASVAKSLMSLTFDAYLKYFNSSLLNFLQEFLKLVFLAVFFFYFNLGLEGLFLAHVLSLLSAVLIFIPVFWGVYKNFSGAETDKSVSLIKILLSHGKWAVLINYSKPIGNNLRLWLIKFLLGTEMVGLFAVAHGLYSHTAGLFPLNLVVRPVIPQYFNDKEKFYKLIAKSVKYQFLGYLAIGIAAFFAFPPVIVWLFPNYASSMFLFRGLLFALLAVSFGGIFTYVFYAIRAQKRFVLNIIIRTFAILLFLPVFVYFFGQLGIIFEFVLSAVIVAIDRYFVLKKSLPGFKISLRDFFAIDDMDRYFMKKIKEFIFTKLNFLRRSK